MEAMKQQRRFHHLDDMLGRQMKFAAALLLLAPLAQTQTRDLEQRAIDAAKQAEVNKLDAKLPRMRFDAWLKQQIGDARIEWESNDCGEQDGFTKRDDVPLCGEASATLPDGRALTVMIGVGTIQKGIQGPPGVWFVAVGNKTSTHLSDLPRFLAPAR
jgi:hypothetical protein